MKKVKIILLCMLLIFSTTTAFAKSKVKNKPQKNADNKIEYLNLNWWNKFEDPLLTEYLLIAYRHNHDLKIASLKVQQGQQIVKQSLSQELPSIQFSGNFARTFRSSDTYFGDMFIPNYNQSNFLLPLTMNYELDLWGQNHLRTKSTKQKLEMLKQDERATYIGLTSALAANYYNLVKLNKLIEVQKELIDTQKTVLTMTEKKYKSGLCPITELIDEQKRLKYFEEDLNSLEEKQDVVKNQLSVYLAQKNSDNIQTIAYEDIKLIETPANIKSELIQNRPDMLKAEQNLKRVGIDVKVARRNFLPKIIIFGQIGFNAYQWKNIFSNPAFLSNAGVAPVFDLFSGGRKLAYLKFKKYELEEASQNYEKTILTSMQEINDSLVSAKTANKNYQNSTERLKLENEKFDLMDKKLNIGAASKLDRLKYQQIILMTEQEDISNKINCLLSAIELYKAVGGKNLYDIEPEYI